MSKVDMWQIADAIRELLDRVTDNSASAMDYVLFGELTMWWELQGREIANRRRTQSDRDSKQGEKR